MLTLYGISNCDTVRRARSWLDAHDVNYRFHDFRKDGLTSDLVSTGLQEVPAEKLINKHSATWRELPDSVRSQADGQAVGLLAEHPTLIKRPVLELANHDIEIGFNVARYEQLLEHT
jgi:arsenate reductase